MQFNPTTYMAGEGDGKVTLTLECGPCAHNYTVGVVCSDGSAQGTYVCHPRQSLTNTHTRAHAQSHPHLHTHTHMYRIFPNF